MVVIGAGMVGASCARAIAGRGRRVALVDRAHAGAGATGRAMGHVMQHDESEPMWNLTRYAQLLWDELGPRLPAACDRRVCGALWVAEEEDLAEADAKAQRFAAHGLRADLLSADEVTRLEPNLTGSDEVRIAGGVFIPTDSLVVALDACRWLVDDAARLGATLLLGVDVEAIDHPAARDATTAPRAPTPGARGVPGGPDQERAARAADATIAPDARVRLADGTSIAARSVVVAAGARSPRLVPWLPIRQRKGHLVLTDPAPGFCRHECVELGYIRHTKAGLGDSVAFNVQMRPAGHVLVGSCRQYDRESDEIEPAMLERMLARAHAFMPALRRLGRATAWTGFRPSTPDGLPIIGRDPRHPWLWLATGHEGYGVTSGIATGEIVADLIDGRSPRIDVSAFAPERFA